MPKTAVKNALMLRHKLSENQQTDTAKRLAESEEKYRALFETSRDALMILDPPNWKFSQANKATLKMFGVPEEADFLRLTPWAISPKKQPDGSASAGKVKEMVEIALKTGSHYFEWDHKCLNGPVFSAEVLLTRVDIGGKRVIQACVRDISARKRMESELALARAGEMVGKMTRPMAHDFNNALAAINGYATLIDDGLAASSPIKTEISRIIEAVRRAAVLTSRLQDFARNPKIENPSELGEKKEGS